MDFSACHPFPPTHKQRSFPLLPGVGMFRFPSGTQPGLLSGSGLAYSSLGGVEADSRSFPLSLPSRCTTRPLPIPPPAQALAGAGGVPLGALPASTMDRGPVSIHPTSYDHCMEKGIVWVPRDRPEAKAVCLSQRSGSWIYLLVMSRYADKK